MRLAQFVQAPFGIPSAALSQPSREALDSMAAQGARHRGASSERRDDEVDVVIGESYPSIRHGTYGTIVRRDRQPVAV